MISVVTGLLCLEIILRVGADLNCSQYMDKFDTKYLPGRLGNSFLILTEAHETGMYLESYCLDEHFPEFEVISSSKGMQTRSDGYVHSILIINNSEQVAGTVMLAFSEKVLLFYKRTALSQMLWKQYVLPTNRLGTEYFIVFPNVDAVEYFCRICSIYNNTGVMIEITKVGKVIAEQTLIKHLDQHEHSVIRRVFDISGSRILSTHNVAVFCFIGNDIQIQTSHEPHQLLPTNVFGRQYYISENVQLINNQISLRLVAISANTTVTASKFPDVNMEFRGQITDLDINIKGITELISKKSFILLSISSSYKLFNTPIEQYAKYVLLTLTGGVLNKIEIYYISMAGESSKFNVDYSHQSKWNPMSVQYDLQMIQNYSDVSVRLMTTTETLGSRINIYITSSLLTAGWIYFYIGERIFYGPIPGTLKVLFKSCRFVDSIGCYEGLCNSTLVENCEWTNVTHNKHKEEKEDVNHIPIVLGAVAALSMTTIVLSAAGRYVYIRNKRRIRPT